MVSPLADRALQLLQNGIATCRKGFASVAKGCRHLPKGICRRCNAKKSPDLDTFAQGVAAQAAVVMDVG